jgi:hypothetical protein
MGKNNCFNPFETGAMFLTSQFSLIFSIFSLILQRKSYAWGKIEEVRAFN